MDCRKETGLLEAGSCYPSGWFIHFHLEVSGPLGDDEYMIWCHLRPRAIQPSFSGPWASCHSCYPLLSLTFLNPLTTPHPLPLFTEMEETARPCGTQSTALSITSFVQLVLSSAVTQESDSLSPSSIPWEALICALGPSEEGWSPALDFLDS